MGTPEEDLTLSDTDRVSGRAALVGNVKAALAVSGAVRSTLGPRGMDKMLIDQDGRVVNTNDGATVLETAMVEHPTARLLIDVSKSQDLIARDGTTTTILILAELLRNSLELTRTGLHPSVIIDGYEKAHAMCLEEIDGISKGITTKKQLNDIISTCIGNKVDSSLLEMIADHASTASESLVGRSIEDERILINRVSMEGGSVKECELVSGFVTRKQRYDHSMPDSGGKSSVAVIDGGIELRELEFDSGLEISTVGFRSDFIARKRERILALVEHLKSLAVDIAILSKGIDDEAHSALQKYGITCFRRFDKEDLERVAEQCGSIIVRSVLELNEDHVGQCDSWSEEKVSKVSYLTISSSKGRGKTFVARGSSTPLRQEIIRMFDDALGVAVRVSGDSPMLPGAGSTWSHLAAVLRRNSSTMHGRTQLAVEGYADALETIPRALAENSGADPIDRIIQLSAAQTKDGAWMGFDVKNNLLVDLQSAGIIDLRIVVETALSGATEGAISVLRINDVLWAKVEPDHPILEESEDED